MKSGSKTVKIDPERWYTAGEAAEFLDVTEPTVTKYCRNGDFKKGKCRKVGPRRQWHILGSEIIRVRKDWNLDI